MMSIIVVLTSSGGYLKAIAHLGFLAVDPKISLSLMEFILTTAPSISKS